MSEQSDDDKQHEPTQKRLDEARKRGEIPKSADLTTAAAYGGFLLVAFFAGAGILLRFGQSGRGLLDQADRLAPLLFARAAAPTGTMIVDFGGTILPLFVAPACAVLLALIGQRALHFAPEKLAPKWSRLSPIAALGQKFGIQGLVEFGKNLAKLCLVACVLGVFLSKNAAQILGSLTLSPASAVALMLHLLLQFMGLLVLLTLGFGGLDYLWQRTRHLHRNRMSRKEMMDESKESEGDPHVKQQRRQRGHEIATNRMLQDVAKADVVVVNPTHYAVALKWDRKSRAAPMCVAKGVDEVAARIREAAAKAGVPLHSDPRTARAIYATVEIGRSIRPEHYRAIAAAIRFAEAMRKRKKRILG